MEIDYGLVVMFVLVLLVIIMWIFLVGPVQGDTNRQAFNEMLLEYNSFPRKIWDSSNREELDSYLKSSPNQYVIYDDTGYPLYNNSPSLPDQVTSIVHAAWGSGRATSSINWEDPHETRAPSIAIKTGSNNRVVRISSMINKAF